MAVELKESLRRHAPQVRDAIARALSGPRRIAWVDRVLGATVDYVLDCKTVRRSLSEICDGALPGWQASLARAHVASCSVCGPVDASLRNTLALLRELGGEHDDSATRDEPWPNKD